MKTCRLLSALTAAALLLGLCACDAKSEDESSESAFQTQRVEQTEGVESPSSGYSPASSTRVPSPSSGTSAASNSSTAPTGGSSAASSQERETVRVTISEGSTLTQIFTKLESAGVASFDDLLSTSQSYDYSYYPLIAARPGNTRAFKLEGYLFPDTYEFYKNEKPQDAIGRFLRNAESKITPAIRSKAASMNLSMDQILTVASIIEKEGSNPNEVRKIAAVIYNRLDAGMQLQMDSGIYYIESRVKPYIGGDINRYNSLYNMNKCAALPAGPIANPGLVTINAALNPADVDYLYFCHDSSANYYYAATYEEHLKNVEAAGI